MAKIVDDTVLDGMLNIIKNNITTMIACSAQPTTRAEAVTTYALADVAMTTTDVIAANGDASGRKATMGAKSTVPVDATGTATHIALVSATVLLYVTTCTSQALTIGNTVNFPAWKIEVADPT